MGDLFGSFFALLGVGYWLWAYTLDDPEFIRNAFCYFISNDGVQTMIGTASDLASGARDSGGILSLPEPLREEGTDCLSPEPPQSESSKAVAFLIGTLVRILILTKVAAGSD